MTARRKRLRSVRVGRYEAADSPCLVLVDGGAAGRARLGRAFLDRLGARSTRRKGLSSSARSSPRPPRPSRVPQAAASSRPLVARRECAATGPDNRPSRLAVDWPCRSGMLDPQEQAGQKIPVEDRVKLKAASDEELAKPSSRGPGSATRRSGRWRRWPNTAPEARPPYRRNGHFRREDRRSGSSGKRDPQCIEPLDPRHARDPHLPALWPGASRGRPRGLCPACLLGAVLHGPPSQPRTSEAGHLQIPA